MKNTVRSKCTRWEVGTSSEINKKRYSRDFEHVLLPQYAAAMHLLYKVLLLDPAGRPVKTFVRFKDTVPLGNRQAWTRNPIRKAFTGRACHS